MKRSVGLLLFLLTLPLGAQSTQPAADPWKAISFLEGTWEAKTTGSQGVTSAGTYTFRTELNSHILARHSMTVAGCKGPAGFDCDHSDLLYVFSDGPGQPLKAIYFDNEGHVIHYNVSTPDAGTAVFLSDGSQPGPAFQLVYQRKDAAMSGKFQMRMPGQSEWKSYLEWSGAKQQDK
jgi:uncharacterized protein YaiE (UPF0345 family)